MTITKIYKDRVEIELDANEVIEGQVSFNSYAVRSIVPIGTTDGVVQASLDGTTFTALDLDPDAVLTVGMLRPFYRVTENATVTFFAI